MLRVLTMYAEGFHVDTYSSFCVHFTINIDGPRGTFGDRYLYRTVVESAILKCEKQTRSKGDVSTKNRPAGYCRLAAEDNTLRLPLLVRVARQAAPNHTISTIGFCSCRALDLPFVYTLKRRGVLRIIHFPRERTEGLGTNLTSVSSSLKASTQRAKTGVPKAQGGPGSVPRALLL